MSFVLFYIINFRSFENDTENYIFEAKDPERTVTIVVGLMARFC